MWWMYVLAIPLGALIIVVGGILVFLLEEYPTQILGTIFFLGISFLIGYAILNSI